MDALDDFKGDFSSSEEDASDQEDHVQDQTSSMEVDNTSEVINKQTLLALVARVRNIEEQAQEEEAETHQLMSEANKAISQADRDITRLRLRLTELYTVRFPELNQLISDSVLYARVVHKVGNLDHIREEDLTGEFFLYSRLWLVFSILHHGYMSKIMFSLLIRIQPSPHYSYTHPGILSNVRISSVMITSATAKLPILSPEVYSQCMALCEEVLLIHDSKETLLKFIEEHMTSAYPNISCLVGPRIASQMVGLAGGIQGMYICVM